MFHDQPALLQTKLHRPSVTRTLVERPLLSEQLYEGLEHPLILVCAPPGFGKTTLISSWIEALSRDEEGASAELPAAWLSLEETESDIIVFTQYLIATLSTIFPDACANTFELLQARRRPSLEYITTSLSNEIEQLPSEFILVLDDFHSVQGEEVPYLLNELLFHWSHTLHLVLISRTEPSLPLARLRTNGQLTEIRSRDLRFNKKEIARFINQVIHEPLKKPLLDKLEKRTEGWIGALRLATLSLRTLSNMEEMLRLLDNSQQIFVDYLMAEVLEKQLPVIQTFLLKTSILDRFCTPLCEAVIGESDSAWSARACLDWIERSELFIVPLDYRREWYRYHHLFQEFLHLSQSELMTPETTADLHIRASIWFEEQGLFDEALRHALVAGDIDLAIRQMSVGLRNLLNRIDRPTLERWLHLLPEEVIQQRPELLMIRAWVLQFQWRLDRQNQVVGKIEALLNSGAAAFLPADDLQILRGLILLFKEQQAYFNNQTEKAIDLGQQVLSLFPTSWTFVHGGASLYLCLSMQASGQTLEAERFLLDAYESSPDKTNVYAQMALESLGLIYLNIGWLEKARQMGQQLLRGTTRSGITILKNWGDHYLGMVHYYWNELEEAAHHFNQLVEKPYSAQITAYRDGNAGLVLIHQIKGESAEAWRLVESISRFDLEDQGYEDDRTSALRARLMLLEGDLASAGLWADSFTRPVPDQALLWLIEPQVTRARILVARARDADLRSAMEILDSLAEIAERTHNTRYKIEILTLRAMALKAQGNSRDSKGDLRLAVKLSKVGGFLRPFVDLGPKMKKMLTKQAQKGYSVKTIQRILAAFPDQQSPSKSGVEDGPSPATNRSPLEYPTLVESLTPREKQVLVQMGEPISFKEIANKLGISYATAKRHSINIYGKLGVNSRWDAVAKAAELDILPR